MDICILTGLTKRVCFIKYMKKIQPYLWYIYVILFICTIALFIDDGKDITYRTSIYKKDIVFVYIWNEPVTTRFGRVIGTNSYMKYGYVDNGKIIVKDYDISYDNFDTHKLYISNESYIEFKAEEALNEDGEIIYSDVIGYNFYLTEDMLSEIDGGV